MPNKPHFKLLCLSISLLCLMVSGVFGTLRSQQVTLETFADGLNQPVGIYHFDESAYYTVEKAGRILMVEPDGSVHTDPPFLDIQSRVESSFGETGLLGMAFHPSFPDSPYVYVNYTDNDLNTHISRFSVDDSSDDLVLDPQSELVLIELEQPFTNHNGGCVRFGPDGYLYIGLGDGGAAGDPGDRAQDPQTLLGKMLRIDVDRGATYDIPADNPFVGDPTTLDEIWALGLRNPWRFSFDPMTGDLWIGDVGQNNWEEIDYQPAGSGGGENYGWRCYEGNQPFDQSGNCNGPFVFPVHEYANTTGFGCSVTGGRVYRGDDFPGLQGKYVFVDYCQGLIQYLDSAQGGGMEAVDLIQGPSGNLVSFGETHEGELLAVAIGEGIVYRLEPACSEVEISAEIGDELCADAHDGSIALDLSGPDTIQSVQWSNGAEHTLTINGLSSGLFQVTIVDEAGCEITESYEVVRRVDGPPILPDMEIDSCMDSLIIDIRMQLPDGLAVDWYRNGSLYESGDEGLITVGSGSYTAQFAAPCMTGPSNVLEVELHPLQDTPVTEEGSGFLAIQPGFDSVQWYYEGSPIPGAQGDTLYYDEAGSYFAEVFNAFGCSARSEVVELTALEHPREERILQIHPNPGSTEQELRIAWKGAPVDGRLEIWRSDGRRQYRTMLRNDREFSIEVEHWPSGLYIIRWMEDGELLGRKIWILGN